MQNKEIEKALNNLWSSTTDVMFNVLYSQEQMQEDLKVVLNEFKNLYRTNEQNKQYIDQLEAREQKLIEKLEEEKYTIESTYSQIDGNYFMAQDRLNLIKEILEILKGEKK